MRSRPRTRSGRRCNACSSWWCHRSRDQRPGPRHAQRLQIGRHRPVQGGDVVVILHAVVGRRHLGAREQQSDQGPVALWVAGLRPAGAGGPSHCGRRRPAGTSATAAATVTALSRPHASCSGACTNCAGQLGVEPPEVISVPATNITPLVECQSSRICLQSAAHQRYGVEGCGVSSWIGRYSEPWPLRPGEERGEPDRGCSRFGYALSPPPTVVLGSSQWWKLPSHSRSAGSPVRSGLPDRRRQHRCPVIVAVDIADREVLVLDLLRLLRLPKVPFAS